MQAHSPFIHLGHHGTFTGSIPSVQQKQMQKRPKAFARPIDEKNDRGKVPTVLQQNRGGLHYIGLRQFEAAIHHMFL